MDLLQLACIFIIDLCALYHRYTDGHWSKSALSCVAFTHVGQDDSRLEGGAMPTTPRSGPRAIATPCSVNQRTALTSQEVVPTAKVAAKGHLHCEPTPGSRSRGTWRDRRVQIRRHHLRLDLGGG
ncbi:hypothetical protein BO99DRAFT_436401 [Aspergillus violaceofuscus CBS 115571]|uniref:Uncharacterized protein n=1 Tax=Aspergillus violaceofuscus (strain CBS 115571) TaxID=1450538 RepID=A0A2V5HHD5_ASPV1|nr:hypothetical protein BO99DRAFT_436401 [Aspergillus violaceofuscus CBS 115571]